MPPRKCCPRIVLRLPKPSALSRFVIPRHASKKRNAVPMSTEQQHLSLFHDPEVESLAIALRKFEALPEETPSRKARVRAAVATVGRLLHLPADQIPAQATFLMRRLGYLKHRPTGLTPKSLANCKQRELRHLTRTLYGRGRRSHIRIPSPENGSRSVMLCQDQNVAHHPRTGRQREKWRAFRRLRRVLRPPQVFLLLPAWLVAG